MHTSCDAAALEHKQQSSAAVRVGGAEATFSPFDCRVGPCPHGNTLYSTGLSESAWTESLLMVKCPRGKESTCVCLCRCTCCQQRESERETERGGLQYSSSHWFSSPAWGCGKCQPLIELIKIVLSFRHKYGFKHERPPHRTTPTGRFTQSERSPDRRAVVRSEFTRLRHCLPGKAGESKRQECRQ